MQRTLFPLVCLVLGWFLGQDKPSGTDGSVPADPLASLAPYVGGEWVAATFPAGSLTDIQRFEWICAKKFLRNTHEVQDSTGKVVYSGETIYGYDVPTQTLRWWYFNATGGWIDGTVALEDDGTLAHEGTNHAPPGQPARVRSSSKLDGEHWTSTTWFEKDGAWKVERELEYRKKPR